MCACTLSTCYYLARDLKYPVTKVKWFNPKEWRVSGHIRFYFLINTNISVMIKCGNVI